jgi:hypothetical protein
MPCDAVRTIRMDFKVANRDILLAGLKAAGFHINTSSSGVIVASKDGNYARIFGGKIEVPEGDEKVINEVKRAYAMETVRAAAKRFGWSLVQDRNDAQHVTVMRR